MQYDIKLALRYDYDAPVTGGRHLVRMTPLTRDGVQRVVSCSASFAPEPVERADFTDFFGNTATAIAYRREHDMLEARLSARVDVQRASEALDAPVQAPGLAGLRGALAALRDLGPCSPLHCLTASGYAAADEALAAYVAERFTCHTNVAEAAGDLCRAIHRDFVYDGQATDVTTSAPQAFALRRGVCQDFAHIMIAGLRSQGVPAGYVSGLLRTVPPPGMTRLEGADAMHAWVRVWCGAAAGWIEFDPTNAQRVGADYIAIAHGRDYSDVAPIIGVLKSAGGQRASQAVDVVACV